jgi:hypothetical protein
MKILYITWAFTTALIGAAIVCSLFILPFVLIPILLSLLK